MTRSTMSVTVVPIHVALVAEAPAEGNPLARQLALVAEKVSPLPMETALASPPSLPADLALAFLAPRATEEEEEVDRFAAAEHRPPFIVLSEANDARRAVHAMKAGALDYFPLLSGGWVDLPSICRCLEGMSVGRPADEAETGNGERPHALSRRERECLALSGEGHNTNAIAFRLGITERTVRFHIANAMAKLHATSRIHAVSRALQEGLLTE